MARRRQTGLMVRLRRTRRGAAVALLAVLANLLIPAMHDAAARAADGERFTICTAQGLVTIVVSERSDRENGPRPFSPLCPDCPSCPLCPPAHVPLALLPMAGIVALSPASAYHAWPAAGDPTTPGRSDRRLASPRAPPTRA